MDTMTDRLVALLLFVTVLCAVLALGAWWADRELERSRPRVPKPERRAVVGQSHKAWM